MLTIRTSNLYLFTIFFGLCIFSAFLIQKVYVGAYIAFTAIVFLYFGKIEFLKVNTKAVLFLMLFFAWSVLVYFLNVEYSQAKQLIKLLVVVWFFFGAITFMNNVEENRYLLRFMTIIYYFLGLILVLNFLHVVRNVMAENLWTMPFSGKLSSTAAYRIENPGVFFGAANKNIWATKILLSWVIFHQYQKRISASGIIPLGVHAASLFSIIYTFSRTAQVVLVAYVFINLLLFIGHKKNLVKYILIVVLLPTFAYGMYKVIPKLIHFKFDPSDGFYSRIILWSSVLELNFTNLVMGNGIQYGAYFIPRFTIIDNDNFHNVFLNQLVDVGLIGLLCYILFMVFYFRVHRGIFNLNMLVLFAPLFLVINSHYLGYDNDIFNYLILVYPLIYFSNRNDNAFSGNSVRKYGR